MITGLLRRVVREVPPPDGSYFRVYELECGHKYYEGNVEAMMRGWALMIDQTCVACAVCDQAQEIPDTVSDCFGDPTEGMD